MTSLPIAMEKFLLIISYLADNDYWDHIFKKLGDFYVQHVIPEVLSGRIFQEEYGTAL